MCITVAGEPTSLEAVTSEYNSSHVNVTVSWESPADPVTGYVIYYQTKGGPVISDMVSGGETETHSLDGLQRGVPYYISILALSQHLPSPLVGPVTVVGEVLIFSSLKQSLLLYSRCSDRSGHIISALIFLIKCSVFIDLYCQSWSSLITNNY